MQVKVTVNEAPPPNTRTSYADIKANTPFIGMPKGHCVKYLWVKPDEDFTKTYGRHPLVCLGILGELGGCFLTGDIEDDGDWVENLQYVDVNTTITIK